MARKIKFRAWNGSKMLMQDEIAFTPGISNVAFRLSDMLHLFTKDYAVMQYTGLDDKNGKEIYEGDIVKNEWGAKTEVCWSDDSLTYFPCSSEIRGNSNWDNREEFEVVGNIYENHKLLNSK